MREPGLFLILVDEPGRDLRALPGFFHDPDMAVSEHVSFQEHPQAARFLLVQVAGQVGPVRPPDSLGGPDAAMARARASRPRTSSSGAAGLRWLPLCPPVASRPPGHGRIVIVGQEQQRLAAERGGAVPCVVSVAVADGRNGELGTYYDGSSVPSLHIPSRLVRGTCLPARSAARQDPTSLCVTVITLRSALAIARPGSGIMEP